MTANENKCSGNCMECTIFQRQYCSAQIAYNNMKMLEQLANAITALQEKTNNDQQLINPTEKS